ncbi:MAG TPA: S49 family peptidase, partial [Elusimicrobiales bacterium]|nr:S49 family peptidase [Elusimicrobiales bacterium]
MEEQNQQGKPETVQDVRVRPTATRYWLKAVAVLYALSLAAAFMVAAKTDSARKAKPDEMELSKLSPLGSQGKGAVAIIPIFGAIYPSDSSRIWDRGGQQIAKRIKLAAERKDVKAVLLDINSPGGSVGSVQGIYSAIMRAKAESKKPFVAHFGDVSASGGYYVAAACDKIVAEPGTITGSIGV